MASYTKPAVLVYQEFKLAPAELVEPLRAHISGPNALLHRFAETDEKALIGLGAYDRTIATNYTWPDRQAGSLVDEDSVKLFIEDALLLYYEDLIGDATGGRGTVVPDADHKNRVTSSAVSYVSNGTSWPRSGLLNDRDVAIGDIAYIRGVAGVDEDCDEYELWTEVTGFVADVQDAVVSPLVNDDNNQATIAADDVIEFTAGFENCLLAEMHGSSSYSGLASGIMEEVYTIEVVKSSVAGCTAARLRVTSASGTDNVDEVDPGTLGDPVEIGTRGAVIAFSLDTGTCETDSDEAGMPSDEFIVGQTWTLTISGVFERTCAIAGSTYTGPDDDTYIIEVTKGGLWADLPEITVTTVKGLDSSGPTTVTDDNLDVPVGTYGLTVSFEDCANLTGSLSVSYDGETGMGNNSIAGLRKGDKFYVTVASGANGPIHTLILRDDLPTALADATDLDLRLFVKKTIEVTKNRLSAPPLVNYSYEQTQIVVKAGITAYDSTWTDGGVEQPMLVYSNATSGNLFVEYREWLTDLVNEVYFIDDVADLDQIPGQLHEDNILKWGVFRALQNSNGTRVSYTAVADPDDLDSWQNVLDRVKGRDDVYNFAPMTHNREVWNLFQAQVNAESSPEQANWKGMFINLQAKTTTKIVGKSTADEQALNPTSTDGSFVLATLLDNPTASGTQYTLLHVPANNSGFVTYGVRAGDIVRFLFTIDAFGASSYQEYVVDSVLSQSSLLLLSGSSSPISVPQKMEVWRSLTRGEIATDLVDQAQSFADRRVVATWPDVVGTAGNAQDGMFLAAALAGLASGVVPHQGLTNVEITGFDDLASRTKDFFTSTQLDQLAAGGVWVATEDRDGTPHTRHGLTTSTIDLSRKEEMIRRNLDSISYLFTNRLRGLIGRANATPAMVRRVRYEVTQIIKFLKRNDYTEYLGPQLIDATIALDNDGQEILRIHPLAADRIEVVLNLVMPAPLNNLELHLVV